MKDPEGAKAYMDLPLSGFLADASAGRPTPGGGSVSALGALLGVSMGMMAAEYTLSNKRYAEHHDAVRPLLDQLTRLKAVLERLMEDDMAAYRAYVAAAKGRNGSAEEKARFQTAVGVAIAVPMEMVAAGSRALKTMTALKPICNAHLLSDLSVGGHLVRGAACGAGEMVRVNLPDAANRAEADQVSQSLSEMLSHVEAYHQQITG